MFPTTASIRSAACLLAHARQHGLGAVDAGDAHRARAAPRSGTSRIAPPPLNDETAP
jgi:hypothetical protein